MVWFMEKNDEVLACEVRRSPDGAYEYEVTASTGETRLQRFDRPTPLLDEYLKEQQELRRQGWRPRLAGG